MVVVGVVVVVVVVVVVAVAAAAAVVGIVESVTQNLGQHLSLAGRGEDGREVLDP